METLTVRKRLEDACAQLDKSIEVLRSEQPAAREDFPQDEIDAGTSLAEGDRAEAILAAADVAALRGRGRAGPDPGRQLRDVRGLRAADPGRAAGGPPGGVPLRELPVQAGPARR